jgi:6-phospho-3-hexuloisomerase
MTDYISLTEHVTDELKKAAAGVEPAQLKALVEELAQAGRIVVYGVGREGLMMRALAMRLYHLGLDAHVIGEMSTPPVGPGDVLLASAGPGEFSTVTSLIGVARAAGARIACVTAQPDRLSGCDLVLTIPAQTMADDQGLSVSSILPMGSLFEGAQFVVFEILVLMLSDHLQVTPAAMRGRHTNLE